MIDIPPLVKQAKLTFDLINSSTPNATNMKEIDRAFVALASDTFECVITDLRRLADAVERLAIAAESPQSIPEPHKSGYNG